MRSISLQQAPMTTDHDPHDHHDDGDGQHDHHDDGDGQHDHHDDGDGQHDHHDDDHHHDDHHQHDVSSLAAGIITVSSSRTAADDPAGDAIASILEAEGHEVARREHVGDDHDRVQQLAQQLLSDDAIELLVTTGGTGVTADDVTIEAVRPLFDRELPGFGELFRHLSYDEIGSRVVGTRATAGVASGVPVFCLPGSENAVRLATEAIIVPEAGHLAGLATRHE